MPDGFPRQIEMNIDEERYWEGLGRQEMDFHQVLCELIDNSISASGYDADGDLLPFTIEIVIQRLGSKIMVKVADQGAGMSLNNLEKYVLLPGGKGTISGPLNEHGFGLKNALCMLSLGNKRPFKIQTRDQAAHKQNHYYLVASPFSSAMEIQLDTEDNWNTNLVHATASKGTRIYAETSYEFFNTLYRRGKFFENPLIIRLGEHLGVTYRHFLANGSSKMWLRWQHQGDNEENPETSADWQERRIHAIDIPYNVKGSVAKEISIKYSGKKAKVIYICGEIDKGKVKDGTKGWPYPLQIYYQGNTATQGVDISVKKRMIKTGQLPEIWRDIARDNHYNSFIGELLLDERFSTVNNKIALDPHSPFWQSLVEELNTNAQFSPTKQTRVYTETNIKERLKVLLESAESRSTVSPDRPIWAGSGVRIDLYHQKPTGIEIYEVKPDTAGPLDVYQLLMYWDGVVVDEGKSPHLARLVAMDAPHSVSNMIEKLNGRTDTLGHDYKFEFIKISEFGI